MFEPELARIEELMAEGSPERAYVEAQKIFSAHEGQYGQDYRDAWEKARDLTSVQVQIGDEIVHATVVNDLENEVEMGADIWLMTHAAGICAFHYAIAARTEQDALDEYADNSALCHRTLVENDDMHEDDCLNLGNAGERHYFEGVGIQRIERPSPDLPFRPVEKALRRSAAPSI